MEHCAKNFRTEALLGGAQGEAGMANYKVVGNTGSTARRLSVPASAAMGECGACPWVRGVDCIPRGLPSRDVREG
jgi:hypothetical protein